MWTLVDDKFGKIMTWNYKNESSYYEGECNAVRGSAGEFYPINRKRDHIEFFSSELCKFAKLEYEKDVEIKGVLGYKYTGKNIFDNGKLPPPTHATNLLSYLTRNPPTRKQMLLRGRVSPVGGVQRVLVQAGLADVPLAASFLQRRPLLYRRDRRGLAPGQARILHHAGTGEWPKIFRQLSLRRSRNFRTKAPSSLIWKVLERNLFGETPCSRLRLHQL
jgi:hypothetical protein